MSLRKEYEELTNSIIYNEKFVLLKQEIHHGTNKYEHSKRVSYLSFIFGKIFKGNTSDIAIAGLLHDFFYGSRTSNEDNSYLKHPITSAKNAKKYFNINENEETIIKSHMYHYATLKKITPFTNLEDRYYLEKYRPKNKDGVIVCICDLLVSIYEVFVYKAKYTAYLYLLFMINFMKY